MDNRNGVTLLIIVVIVLVVLFVLFRCKLNCNVREGYTRSCFSSKCSEFERSPVDFVYKVPGTFRRNPHYQADPGNYYQTLQAPIDLYAEERRQNAGELFQQYENTWEGCGKIPEYLPNDEKTRFDFSESGKLKSRRILANMYHPRFGRVRSC